MSVFETPHPITASVEFGIGHLRLVAGDGAETVVEVKPSDPGSRGDVTAAEQTQVDYSSGSLTVRGPRNWRRWTPRGGRESIDVEIHLPQGSRVAAELGMASVHASGRLGDLTVRTGMGDVTADEAGSVSIRTGFGEVNLGRVGGDADVRTGSGRIDIAAVKGSATVRNSNGDTRIGEVAGRGELRNANGSIEVERAGSQLAARTALGDVRLGLLSHGATDASTACGRIDIGVLDGVAAWLELSTGFGRVRNELEDAARPPAHEQTVEVRAHTAAGDIDVRRVAARAGSAAR